ncbi:MAG: hypothetical protein PHP27_04000 [Bacteroidales bacterium]|nr:hypothetical protein [Bacteroidales bacterium]
MNFVNAYQTLEFRNNNNIVELYGPFKCERDIAWLGKGYYFWDTNIQLAKEWGNNAYIKSRYIIGKCRLDLSTCFDLFGNIEHQLEFKEVINLVKSHNLFKEEQIIVPNLIEYMKLKGVFNYKSIRAKDEKIQNEDNKVYFTCNKKEYLTLGNRVQICVIDKRGVIKSKFKIVFSSN